MEQNFLNFLPADLKNTFSELYDLILSRSLSRAYDKLSDEEKSSLAQIFNSGADEEKNEFLKRYFKDLKTVVQEEVATINKKLKEKFI
ncbi:MAG: hypothetical protein WC042_01895 [Candidatus Paceibacterota bacterium]|jgi:succinate dehydrogenase flavin-adding protein (antitoxin of CptAB toxin-antitoxin module)|nr:hypothetical protein [Candidatus Paceibacterota bacterium]MDD4998950.1 hypothetical protein [Candidatus Paceibacterota bacterium]